MEHIAMSRREPKPIFMSKSHVIRPSTYHQDMYIWYDRKTGHYCFNMSASIAWLEEQFKRVL